MTADPGGSAGVFDGLGEDRQREAAILTRYLIGASANRQETVLYARAVCAAPLIRPEDQRVWRWMMGHPRLVPFLDAGLARADPASPVRHRILIMLAILEASPRHCDQFLSRRFGVVAFVATGLSLAVGVLRTLVGMIMLRV